MLLQIFVGSALLIVNITMAAIAAMFPGRQSSGGSALAPSSRIATIAS